MREVETHRWRVRLLLDAHGDVSLLGLYLIAMMSKPRAILSALVLIPLGACGLLQATVRSPHFTARPDPTVLAPPLENLFLWLEFGEETMSVNPSGLVTRWRDAPKLRDD